VRAAGGLCGQLRAVRAAAGLCGGCSGCEGGWLASAGACAVRPASGERRPASSRGRPSQNVLVVTSG